ncbi:LemA family protein [bacterium]|nr:LemA family protein [bacterium]
MQDSIIFFALLILILIVFNSWYTAYKVCGQTKQAFDEFDLQLRRRLDLIAELIKEISKHIKKNPLQKAFNDVVQKINEASWSEVGEMVTKEMNAILSSALLMVKKYPKIIPKAKLESIKREIEKVDSAIESAKDAYLKNSEFLQKWMGKFPFNKFKEWHFDIDKVEKKMESKKVLDDDEEKIVEKEIEDFVASFKKKKVAKKRKTTPAKGKAGKREGVKKNNKTSAKKPSTKKTKK